MIAIEQNGARQTTSKMECCSGETSNHKREDRPAIDVVHDECCSGCKIKGIDAEASVDDNAARASTRKHSFDTYNDACCAGNGKALEKSLQYACCPKKDEAEATEKYQGSCSSNDHKKASEIICQNTNCSGESERSNKLETDDRCSGLVNDIDKPGSAMACCERKSVPCCDGQKLATHPLLPSFDCSQLHALNVLRFESAKATAVKSLLVMGLELQVLLVQLTRSVPLKNIMRN